MTSEDTPRPKRSLSKQKTQQKVKSEKVKTDWVFLVKDELLPLEAADGKDTDEGDCHLNICQLRHPRRNEASLYILSPDGKSVHEVNSFKEQHRSWFFGNRVLGEGQMHMSTPVDPMFLVLPYLMNASNSKRFMSLDQIVCDEEFPDCHRLLSCSGLDQLSQVADTKDIDEELKVFRYNAEKALSWLQRKTEAAADAIKEKNVNISIGGSHSSMFIRSNKTEGPPREDYIEFAFGIISDYLPLELEAKLKDHLGIKEKQPVPKEEIAENEPPAKKAKTEDGVLEDYSQQYGLKKEKSKPKLTAAQKRLSKVDKSGMKSISSFFSSKS